MTSDRGITYVGRKGGGGNRPGEDGPYRPPNPNEAPPYPPKKLAVELPKIPKDKGKSPDPNKGYRKGLLDPHDSKRGSKIPKA